MRAYGLLLFAVCAPAAAAQIDRLEVSRLDGRYDVTMDVRLDADAARAFAAFADPAKLPLINSAVKLARVVAGSAPTFDLYTEVYVCASVFCRTLKQTQSMRLRSNGNGGTIIADVQPDISDFSYGHAEWTFAAAGPATKLHFVMAVTPQFWIPPIVGPWFVSRSLRAEAERTCAGIERVAPAP